MCFDDLNYTHERLLIDNTALLINDNRLTWNISSRVDLLTDGVMPQKRVFWQYGNGWRYAIKTNFTPIGNFGNALYWWRHFYVVASLPTNTSFSPLNLSWSIRTERQAEDIKTLSRNTNLLIGDDVSSCCLRGCQLHLRLEWVETCNPKGYGVRTFTDVIISNVLRLLVAESNVTLVRGLHLKDSRLESLFR